jgi:hypothetical protein
LANLSGWDEIEIHVMSRVANVDFNTLMASASGSNWVQDTIIANLAATADWMDPNASSGPGAVSQAANAFAGPNRSG